MLIRDPQVARVASHANNNVGNIAEIHNYKYFDYIFTCPLLVYYPDCVLGIECLVRLSYGSDFVLNAQTFDMLNTLNLPVLLIVCIS